MMGCIGVTVGVVCYLLKTFIELFAHIKYVGVRYGDSRRADFSHPCYHTARHPSI